MRVKRGKQNAHICNVQDLFFDVLMLDITMEF